MEEWRGSKESEVEMKVNEVKNEEEEDQKEESWSEQKKSDGQRFQFRKDRGPEMKMKGEKQRS